MADTDTSESNVIDFIPHFLERMADEAYRKGNSQLAQAIHLTIDKYEAGDIGIELREGMAYIVAYGPEYEYDGE